MSWWWWEDGATRHMGLSRIFPPRPLGPLVWPLLGRRWWCLFDVETERQLGECNFGGLQQYLRVTSAEQPHSYAPTHTPSTKATYTTPPPPFFIQYSKEPERTLPVRPLIHSLRLPPRPPKPIASSAMSFSIVSLHFSNCALWCVLLAAIIARIFLYLKQTTNRQKNKSLIE